MTLQHHEHIVGRITAIRYLIYDSEKLYSEKLQRKLSFTLLLVAYEWLSIVKIIQEGILRLLSRGVHDLDLIKLDKNTSIDNFLPQ